MSQKIVFLILVLPFLNGCTEKEDRDFTQIDAEISNLKSDDEKKLYLEKIFQEDQKFRQAESGEIFLKYGENSQEYKDYMKKQASQDSINLVKVERYFLQYGYPERSAVGEIAAVTPWAVIHHAKTLEDREINFKYVYGAHQNGDIDDGAFLMYLGRMYEIKNRKRFRSEGRFTSQGEIDFLIKELELID